MPEGGSPTSGLGCDGFITRSAENKFRNDTSRNKTGQDLPMTTFCKRKRTRIGTWNVQTMLQSTKLAQIIREFNAYKLQLLGICEIRWADSGEFKTSTGDTLLYSCKPATQDRSSGVGLLMSSSTHRSLIDWYPVSHRIIKARFKSYARNVNIIQVYAPTNVTEKEEKENFYHQLSTTLEKIKKGDLVILMGDLNAKIGNDNTNYEHVMGRHGLGELNENGEMFIDLCSNHDLVIGESLFPHKRIHKGTWMSPNGQTINQIDHITINRKWKTSLLDVRCRRGADVHSDHILLVGKIRIKLACIKRTNIQRREKYDMTKLKILNKMKS